jgi:hypothetical protein
MGQLVADRKGNRGTLGPVLRDGREWRTDSVMTSFSSYLITAWGVRRPQGSVACRRLSLTTLGVHVACMPEEAIDYLVVHLLSLTHMGRENGDAGIGTTAGAKHACLAGLTR